MMERESTELSYGQRTSSELPLIEQKRRSAMITKTVAGKASKAFKATLKRELRKLQSA